MRKIKVSYEQFNEFEEQQKIRDLTSDISSDLAYLGSLCSPEDRKVIIGYIRFINGLRRDSIEKIENILEWVEDDEK